MNKNTIESNMETLKEMLLDEERLVTYVSLSKDLCIHVNESKTLLNEVVTKLKASQSGIELNVSYIISGLLEKNKAQTSVCSEQDLDEVKSRYKIVFFEHIYGVGKGASSTDNVAFLALNKFEDFPLCTGLIRSNICDKRATDEIITLKSNSQKALEQKVSTPLQKKIKTDSKHVNEHIKNVVKVHETKSEPNVKIEQISPKKDSQTSLKSSSKPIINGTKTPKAKGIAGFFGKSNSAPSAKIINEKKPEKDTKVTNDIKTEIKKKEIKAEKMEIDEEETPVKEKQKTEVKSSKKIKKQNGKDDSLTKIKKNAKVNKNRKRVLQVSDSESEDEKNDPFVREPVANSESEDEIPPTPTINTVKVTSNLINPKKKRKIVDKTYTDEDGYILTKKEEVYESMSENEADIDTKENVKTEPLNQVKKENHVKTEVSPKSKKTESKISKKKVSPPQKGKQSTIMNFFQKA